MTTKELLEYDSIASVTNGLKEVKSNNCLFLYQQNTQVTINKSDYNDPYYNSIGAYIVLKGDLCGLIGKITKVDFDTFQVEIFPTMGEE